MEPEIRKTVSAWLITLSFCSHLHMTEIRKTSRKCQSHKAVNSSSMQNNFYVSSFGTRYRRTGGYWTRHSQFSMTRPPPPKMVEEDGFSSHYDIAYLILFKLAPFLTF